MKQTFSPVTNLDRLIETQKPDTVYHGHNGVELGWRELTGKPELSNSQQRLAQDIKSGLRKYQPMGKLQEVALRIKQTKAHLESEADKLLTRLDGIDKKAPSAFDRGNAILDQHNTDLDAMDSELRQLSNIPLGESSTS